MFNKFKFKKLISKGIFGNIYVVTENIDNEEKKFIIKEIAVEKNLEPEILLRLKHKNIIKVFSVYYSYSHTYLKMEYIPNGDLYHFMNDTSLQPSVIYNIFYQLSNALAYCHRLNIIHNDIKPENVLIHICEAKIKVKLIDFGLSIYIQTKDKPATGTHEYMCPDKLNGYQYNEKTDIWSMGIMLYEIIEKKLPFVSVDILDLYSMIINNEPKFYLSNSHIKSIILILLRKNSLTRPSAKKTKLIFKTLYLLNL
jgi:serine/threonine protein kinase